MDFFMFKLSLKAPQPLFLSDLGRDILILGALNFGAKIKGSQTTVRKKKIICKVWNIVVGVQK